MKMVVRSWRTRDGTLTHKVAPTNSRFYLVVHNMRGNHDDVRIIGPVFNARGEPNIKMKGRRVSHVWTNTTKKVIHDWLFEEHGAYETAVWFARAESRAAAMSVQPTDYEVAVAADCEPLL